MSNLPGSPLPPPPPPPFLPGPTTAVEFNPINPTHPNPNPNPSSTHTNRAFIISIVVSAIGVILIGLVCFALGYWLRKKLMAPPPPQQSTTIHQVPHHSQLDHPCCSHVPGGCSRAASPPPPPQQSTTVHQVPHHSQLDHPCCSHVPGGCSRAPRV